MSWDDEDVGPGPGAESRIRTHMANERTFLSWFRTAIALIALGLAAAEFLTRGVLPGVPVARAIALALIGSGVLAVLAGARRYYVTARRIETGTYRPARFSIVAMVVILLALAVLAILFTMRLRPSASALWMANKLALPGHAAQIISLAGMLVAGCWM